MVSQPDDSPLNRFERNRLREEQLYRFLLDQNRMLNQRGLYDYHLQQMNHASQNLYRVMGGSPLSQSPFDPMHGVAGLIGGVGGKGGGGSLGGMYAEPCTAEWEAKEITGEFVGWRAWKFENGQLKSPYYDQLWRPNATIKADRKPAKSLGGIYAHKTKARLMEQESGWTIVGTVLLWGDVIEHEHGYRAEFARVGQIIDFAEDATDSFKAWLKAEFSNEEYPQI